MAALAAATGLVAILELVLGMENASPVYLLAVAAVAIRRGTIPAILTAVGAFLVYNLLFVEPRITFGVARPEQLALRREREARALFAISRELATAHRVETALPTVLDRLVDEAQLTRAWIGIGPTIAQERAIADTSPEEPLPSASLHFRLQRDRE